MTTTDRKQSRDFAKKIPRPFVRDFLVRRGVLPSMLSLILRPARWVRFAADPRAGGAERSATVDADPEQLHDLVVEHGDAVFRVAMSVVRDRALAEDVAQEALMKAWLALPSFRGDSALRSWLLRITHNHAISTLRTRRAIVTDPHEMPERIEPVSRSVEHQVERGFVREEFEAALDDLDDLSRTIVVLRELEGMAYDEIARTLDIALPTVKTRLLRARRRLGLSLREWNE